MKIDRQALAREVKAFLAENKGIGMAFGVKALTDDTNRLTHLPFEGLGSIPIPISAEVCLKHLVINMHNVIAYSFYVYFEGFEKNQGVFYHYNTRRFFRVQHFQTIPAGQWLIRGALLFQKPPNDGEAGCDADAFGIIQPSSRWSHLPAKETLHHRSRSESVHPAQPQPW